MRMYCKYVSVPGARPGLNLHVVSCAARRGAEAVLRYLARASSPAYIQSPSAMSSEVADEDMLLLGRRESAILTNHLHLHYPVFTQKCHLYVEDGMHQASRIFSVLQPNVNA
jgi:hypothetical protein